MDNKPDLDKLMYLLGQENAVEELKNIKIIKLTSLKIKILFKVTIIQTLLRVLIKRGKKL